MQVSCNQAKKYALTVGKEYGVVHSTEKRFTIINDNNTAQNYSKDLFNEIVMPAADDSVRPVVPVPVEPEIVLPTLVSIIDTIAIDEGNYTIRVGTRGRYTRWGVLEVVSTVISCGIYQMYSLNDLARIISRFVEEKIDTIDTDGHTAEEVCSLIFKKMVQLSIADSHDTAMLILSTNTNSDVYDIINNALNSFDSVTAVTTRNPNSGNDITLWTLSDLG
tara:strand:+ start:3427 stop:4086 length:660 start_codon:yes stop_codon:yes gene_type:complete